jgi:hypothetical protein
VAGLLSMDMFGDSDPVVVISMQEHGHHLGGYLGGHRWVEIGRTETISNDNDPEFEYRHKMRYLLDKEQVRLAARQNRAKLISFSTAFLHLRYCGSMCTISIKRKSLSASKISSAE